jgi:hypothetical protein
MGHSGHTRLLIPFHVCVRRSVPQYSDLTLLSFKGVLCD